MPFKTPNKTSEYIRELLPLDNQLKQLIDYADTHNVPILLPESAAFLKQLILLKQPKNVLEIGMGIGYSGHIFLKNSECNLATIEIDKQRIDMAKEFFEQAGLSNRVAILQGDEGEIVPKIDDKFDFIFLDGAKAKYIKHLPYLKKMLKKGGILLADNVLFNGMIADENEVDRSKKGIVNGLRNFLSEICKDTDFITSIINTGDGMSLSILK
ncbi:MAG: O-methyltransferase [Firmicutes bacterium]|nr:O-methyltransferase [Bacillota bacterium]